MFFHFVTKHACDGRTDRQTDGRTDGRTELRSPRPRYGRETARILICFRLTSSVIRKIMHYIAFLGHPVGASGAISALYVNVLMQRNYEVEFHRENVSFTHKTAN